jgi:hypothetical protein
MVAAHTLLEAGALGHHPTTEAMSAHGRLLGLSLILGVVVLVGLFRRRRVGRCYSLVAYLLALTICEGLVFLWPARFWNYHFYVFKESAYGAAKLILVAELAWRTFRVFRGTHMRLRVLAGPGLIAATIAIIKLSSGTPLRKGSWADAISVSHADVQGWIVWALVAMALLVYYYSLPLDPLHWAVVLGLGYYLGFLASTSSLLHLFGFDRARLPISLINGYAYAVLMLWWIYAAWRPEHGLPEEVAEIQKAVRARYA